MFNLDRDYPQPVFWAIGTIRPAAVFRAMKPGSERLIYTILSEDEPIAALAATRTEARGLCQEQWFLEELAALKSNGIPLYGPGIRLRARPATEDEWLRYDRAAKEVGGSEDMLFVYLVHLD